MTGILLAILAAILITIGDAGKKRLTQLYTNQFCVIWSTVFITGIVNLLYLSVTGFPDVDWKLFWMCYLPCLCLIITAEVTFILSIRDSDFSLVVPFKSFAPVFALIIAFFYLEEVPTNEALIGVLIICLGGYLINLDRTKPNYLLAPFKAVIEDPGPRYMLFGTFIFALISNLMKVGGLASSPIFFFTATLLGQVLIFTIYFYSIGVLPASDLIRNPKHSLLTALPWGIGLNCIYLSYRYTYVGYAVAILQVQLVLAVLVGYFYFKEKTIVKRLGACALMISGVLLIIFKG